MMENLPGCWASMTAAEREECRELLALVESKPPAPVERAAQTRLLELMDAASARDRRLWSLRDPSMPTLLSATHHHHAHDC
jgi:hypothetical protein